MSPYRALHPCNHPGCPMLTNERYCDKHTRQHKREKEQYREKEQHRENSYQRGYTKRWARYRKSFLAAHPLCRECAKRNLIVAATVVDHIVPHKGDYDLFWETMNHQPLCAECHNRKTATEDGGFGNE